ncbi:MAG: magnesium transporter CorA family protein, partial [Butyricicoccus sp.]
MVEYFKTIAGRITAIKEFEDGCWINIVRPSSEELSQVFAQTGAEEDFIRAALDPEESSRVEVEEDQVLMIVDIPTVEKERENEEGTQIFGTLPMG